MTVNLRTVATVLTAAAVLATPAVVGTPASATPASGPAPAAVSAVSPATDWEQWGGAADHAGWSRSVAPISVRRVDDLHRTARFPTPLLDNAFAGCPVLAGGSLYGRDAAGRLTAVSAATGQVRWRSAEATWPCPAVADGRVWVSTGPDLVAFSVANGAVIARLHQDPGRVFSWVTTVGDRVYALSTDGQRDAAVIAFRTDTLGVVLSRPLSGFVEDVSSPPFTVDGDQLVVATSNDAGGTATGTVTSYSTTTGAVRWSVGFDTFVSNVAVAGGRVFVGGGHPAAIAESSGTLLWNRAGWFVNGGVSSDGDTVYYTLGEATATPAGGDGDVVALDAATGTRRWTTSFSDEGASAAVVGGGLVFVNDYFGGTVSLLDARTGAVLRRLGNGGDFQYDGQPLVVDGTLYLLASRYDASGMGHRFLDVWKP